MGFILTSKLRDLSQKGIEFQTPASRLAAALVVFIVYLAIGAGIFHTIEGPSEDVEVDRFDAMKRAFLDTRTCLQEEDLDRLINTVVTATNKGIAVSKNVTPEHNWSFGQSFFFAGTLVSTVGYGHVSPQTQGGKAFTIIYAILGIPLALALLTAFVERLKLITQWFLEVLNVKFGHLFTQIQIRLIHLTILLMIVLVVMFFIPSAIFSSIEPDWTFLDAFYYCFISLTTVGLGDYIPGDGPSQPLREVYKVFTTVYLFIGICSMLLLLAVFYDVPAFNFAKLFALSSDDDEKIKFAAKGAGPNYSRQVDDESNITPSSSVASDVHDTNLVSAYQPVHGHQ